MLLEGIGGFIAGSLAMLGDAAHMMTDAASFATSLIAVYLAEKGVTSTMTFGHGRIEVLAALSSTLAIWLVTGLLVGEAVRRMRAFFRGEAEPVDGRIMTILGTIGVCMNIILERVLGGHDHLPGSGHSHAHGHCHAHSPVHSPVKNKSHELVPPRNSGNTKTDHAHEHAHGRVQIEDGLHSNDNAHEHSHAHASSHSHTNDHSHDHSEHSHEHHSEADHDHHSERSHLAVGSTEAARHGKYSAVSTNEHEEHGPGSSSWLMTGVNLNLDAAYLHVLGDLVQSIGVVVAGIIIWIHPDMQIADPICTLLFAIVVLITTFSMIKRIVLVLLQGAPANINVEDLGESMSNIECVCDVHDLHVWELSPGRAILTVHIGIFPDAIRNSDEILDQAHKIAEAAGIQYSTIQVQKMYDGKCAASSCFSSSSPKNASTDASSTTKHKHAAMV